MTIDDAFTTLLTEIKLALQESLARSNAATEAGNFDLVELELERQRNLVSLRNQLQGLQEAWPDMVGEHQLIPAEKENEGVDEQNKNAGHIPKVEEKSIAIFARYKGQRFEATLLPDHRVLFNGQEFTSPSAVATAVTNTNVNGWRFWYYLDQKDRKRPINDLRTSSAKPKQIRQQAQKVKSGNKRLPKGVRTPEEEFVLPILTTLIELNGRGAVAEVLDRVGQRMGNQLNEADHQPHKDGQPRWRNTAQWARQRMKDQGLLAANSPYGTWEITEQGRAYLREHSRRSISE